MTATTTNTTNTTNTTPATEPPAVPPLPFGVEIYQPPVVESTTGAPSNPPDAETGDPP